MRATVVPAMPPSLWSDDVRVKELEYEWRRSEGERERERGNGRPPYGDETLILLSDMTLDKATGAFRFRLRRLIDGYPFLNLLPLGLAAGS